MGRPVDFDTVTAEPAEESDLRALADHLVADGGAVTVRDAAGHEVTLPGSVGQVLTEAARQLAAGNAVSLVPTHVELTTQQAADLLNVSRPYLVRLLEAKEIPYDRIGTHRRVRLADVLEYRQHRAEHREAVLRRMGERAEELGLEY
jgi:excisionase family DNA binding protein